MKKAVRALIQRFINCMCRLEACYLKEERQAGDFRFLKCSNCGREVSEYFGSFHVHKRGREL